jgi:uncharacterized iron-regulated membrane protein
MIRKWIFWPHLVIGLVAGLVILFLSVTGVLLMYEKQIVRAWEWDSRASAPAGVTEKMRVDDLVRKVVAAGVTSPSRVTVWKDPEAPVELAIPKEGRLLVNAYTGDVIGPGAEKLDEFFHDIIRLHRWMTFSNVRNKIGHWFTWTCNLALIFLIVSGLYLWFPIKWTKAGWKAVTIFKPFAKGKARDWNWHTTLGFYTLVPLLFIAVTGLVIGDTRVNDWMFRSFGLNLKAEKKAATTQKAAEPAKAVASAKAGESEDGDDQPDAKKPAAATQPVRARRPPRDVPPEDFARVWTAAITHRPDWTMMYTQWPVIRGGKASFSIDTGGSANYTQPMARVSLQLNAADAAVIETKGWAKLHPARQARAVVRHGHTGEFLGFWGQTLAGVVSAISALLVYTGFTLSWRRFFGKKKRSRKRATATAEATETAVVS